MSEQQTKTLTLWVGFLDGKPAIRSDDDYRRYVDHFLTRKSAREVYKDVRLATLKFGGSTR